MQVIGKTNIYDCLTNFLKMSRHRRAGFISYFHEDFVTPDSYHRER